MEQTPNMRSPRITACGHSFRRLPKQPCAPSIRRESHTRLGSRPALGRWRSLCRHPTVSPTERTTPSEQEGPAGDPSLGQRARTTELSTMTTEHAVAAAGRMRASCRSSLLRYLHTWKGERTVVRTLSLSCHHAAGHNQDRGRTWCAISMLSPGSDAPRHTT
jgi:hypothetical protein